MKKLLSLFIIVIITICGYSQNQQVIDSLLSVLKAAKPDTAKVNTLIRLADEFIDNNPNPDTAIYFASQSQELAMKLNYKMGIANAYLTTGNALSHLGNNSKAIELCNDALDLYNQLLSSEKINEKSKILKQKARTYHIIGGIYEEQSEYPEALKNFFAALKILEEIGLKIGIASCYHDIGITFYLQGNYPEALKNYFASLKIREEIGDKLGIAGSYMGIGSVFYDQSNYPEAVKNYYAALRICEEIGHKLGIAFSNSNLGNVYSSEGNYDEALKNYFAGLKISEEIGDKYEISDNYLNIGVTYKLTGNYPEALKYYFAALTIKEELSDKNGISKIYNNIANTYFAQENYPEALKNYFASLKIREEIGDKSGIAGSHIGIGQVYIEQKKYGEAFQYLNKGLLLAKEVGRLEWINIFYGSLAKLDSAQGNFKKSLQYYKMYIITRDSMFNKENTKKLVQSQMQYEFDKKEALTKAEQEKKDAVAIKELQKQKLVRNGFVGGFAVVLLFAGVFFTQRNKIKIGKKRSDELLLNILPEEVAEELKAKGSAEAKLIDEVTVLFTDFKGFTQLAEKLTPKELVSEIDECFSAFDHIMLKHGVEKIKTIGDSYMAAGGLPTPNKTHAFDVVKAALDIRQYMNEYKSKKDAAGNLSFEIRIGVHTGPVVAGIVGVKKFAYDIWGDTVNTASRMESSGEPDKVNISGVTYELVKDEFNCTYRGKVKAKGKGEVDMYFIENK
jgi:class 3 adenylate cyclase/tetratricopeptide (TPR) repeat protein